MSSSELMPFCELGTTCPKCGLYEVYLCPKCHKCYQCSHAFLERLDGWWVKCKGTGKWFKMEGPGCCHGLGKSCPICYRLREDKTPLPPFLMYKEE